MDDHTRDYTYYIIGMPADNDPRRYIYLSRLPNQDPVEVIDGLDLLREMGGAYVNAVILRRVHSSDRGFLPISQGHEAWLRTVSKGEVSVG